MARGTALWESLVGNPLGKASSDNHRSLDPCEVKRDTAATAREESARACPHSSRGLTPLGRLQKSPKIHVGTGEESSGSGTNSTQGLRPRHRRERNPEKPKSNLHGDWPFMRPPERVSAVQVVSRDLQLQLEKIQEVLPSRRDVAHIRRGVSRLINKRLELTKGPSNPSCTQEVPRNTPLHSRGSTRVLPTSRGARFRLIAREEGSFPCIIRKEFPAFPSHLKRRPNHRNGDRNSRVLPPFPESPRCLSPFQGNLFSLHCLDFQAEHRLTARWHVEQPFVKASWESLE